MNIDDTYVLNPENEFFESPECPKYGSIHTLFICYKQWASSHYPRYKPQRKMFQNDVMKKYKLINKQPELYSRL